MGEIATKVGQSDLKAASPSAAAAPPDDSRSAWDCPVAKRRTVSEVDVSPSMVIALKLSRTASARQL
jgi:hypothetical protein